MNSTDIEYVLHCIKNASELINQSESEKAKGLLLSAELLLSEKLTSDNSDYAKSCDDCIYGVDGCQHEPPCTTGTGKPYYKKRDFA